MIVKRKSIISGIEREMDLPITEEQMKAYERGTLVQKAFPDLDADHREFILTGITVEEWDETMKESE